MTSQGGGVLYDLGSHIISLARYIAGPIQEVLGTLTTVVPERPTNSGVLAKFMWMIRLTAWFF